MALTRRRLVFAAFTLGASFFAMGLSYLVVRWLTLGMDQEPPLDPAIQRRAILLRGFANDLTRACNAYAQTIGTPGGPVSRDARLWIDRVFRRDIRFLEQQLDNNPMTTLPAFVQFRAAARRCDSMARNPEDKALRQATFQDVKTAITAANAYIATINMARSAGPAPVPVFFE